jgi:hypothetical protein
LYFWEAVKADFTGLRVAFGRRDARVVKTIASSQRTSLRRKPVLCYFLGAGVAYQRRAWLKSQMKDQHHVTFRAKLAVGVKADKTGRTGSRPNDSA